MKSTPIHSHDIDGHLHALVEALWGASARWGDVRDVLEELSARAPGNVDVLVLPWAPPNDAVGQHLRVLLLSDALRAELAGIDDAAPHVDP